MVLTGTCVTVIDKLLPMGTFIWGSPDVRLSDFALGTDCKVLMQDTGMYAPEVNMHDTGWNSSPRQHYCNYC